MKIENILKTWAFLTGFILFISSLYTTSGLWCFIGLIFIYLSDVVTGFIKDMQYKMEMKEMAKDLKKVKDIKEEKKVCTYKSVKDMFENIEERRNKFEKFIHKHDWLFKLRSILWYRLLEHPSDLHLGIRTKYQRANRGWAVSDAWGFDWYLTDVIIGGCEYLKKHKQGVPMQCFKESDPVDKNGAHTDETVELANKRWDDILDNIIDTFKTAKHIQENHWHYQESEEYSVKQANRYRKINKELKKENPDLWERRALHVMTKKECKQYEEGWNTFRIYFFSLWN